MEGARVESWTTLSELGAQDRPLWEGGIKNWLLRNRSGRSGIGGEVVEAGRLKAGL